MSPNLRNLYECPKCGDVWRVGVIEHIDTDRDEVYPDRVCDNCGQSVREKKGPQGEPCYTEISDEERYFDEEYSAWLAGEVDDDGYAAAGIGGDDGFDS